MAEYFDRSQWQQIVRRPDWYVELQPELSQLRAAWEDPANPDAEHMKRAVRGFFAESLELGRVSLGSSGPDWDAERQPIDTIVIHHTSAPSGYSLPYMNATQLLNVYAPYYANPAGRAELHGQAVWSNHVRAGRPVFYLYHWLARMDGTFERLLEDREIGWHAANWDVNRRSIAICLDNDYEHQDPEPALIARLGRFIAEQYPQVPVDSIVGHGEVSNHPTICPGGGFTASWKPQLQEAARKA